MRRLIVFLFILCFSASLMAGGQKAGEFKYPTKTIELLAGSPGTDNDLFPRITAKYLEKMWGVPVIVTTNERNLVNMNRINTAAPDGYTVLGFQDNMLINMVSGVLDFTLDDITIISQYAETPGHCIAVRADSGWKTLNDLARAAEARPDTIALGVQFAGTTGVMAGMLVNAGLKVRLVDGGGSERVQMLEGGHIDAALQTWQMCAPFVEAGKWNVLGINNAERAEICPDVPTAREQGFDSVWPTRHVFYMPKDVDPRIVDVWSEALSTLSKDPAYIKEMFDTVGGQVNYSDPVESRKILDDVLTLLREYLN